MDLFRRGGPAPPLVELVETRGDARRPQVHRVVSRRSLALAPQPPRACWFRRAQPAWVAVPAPGLQPLYVIFSFSLAGRDWQTRRMPSARSSASRTSLCLSLTSPSRTTQAQALQLPSRQEYGALTPFSSR